MLNDQHQRAFETIILFNSKMSQMLLQNIFNLLNSQISI